RCSARVLRRPRGLLLSRGARHHRHSRDVVRVDRGHGHDHAAGGPCARECAMTGAVAPSADHVTEPYRDIIYGEDGPVARITLNRPHVRNALSMRMSDELTHALERLRDSSTVKVVVLRGARGTFCAGDDITEMPQWGS